MSIQFDQYRKITSLFTAGAHYYMPEVKYVHQLQNLYHSLTGEELIEQTVQSKIEYIQKKWDDLNNQIK